jgi:NAD+ synthase (glutamine-hydrolysing)
MLKDLGHPFGRGEPVYDVTFENVQAGLRTDYLFRRPTSAAASCSAPATCPSWRSAGARTASATRCRHYGVNTGVPKTLMQHLIRWVITSGQFDGGSTARSRRSSTQEITPELVPTVQEGERRSPPRTPSGRTPCRTSPSSTSCGAATARARSPSSPSTPGRMPAAASGRRATPEGRGRHTTWRRSGGGCEVFVRRFFGFNQFKRSAMPNGPKVVSGGSLSPRGDWRMPSDAGSATTWLDELEANVPEA